MLTCGFVDDDDWEAEELAPVEASKPEKEKQSWEDDDESDEDEVLLPPDRISPDETVRGRKHLFLSQNQRMRAKKTQNSSQKKKSKQTKQGQDLYSSAGALRHSICTEPARENVKVFHQSCTPVVHQILKCKSLSCI